VPCAPAWLIAMARAVRVSVGYAIRLASHTRLAQTRLCLWNRLLQTTRTRVATMRFGRRAAWLLIICSAASNSAATERMIELAVPRDSAAARHAEPRLLRVVQEDGVRLRIASDTAGETHLHGYRLDARVSPGRVAELDFNAHATGRYRI